MRNRILVAVELDEQSASYVLGRAVGLAEDKTEIEVVHVVDPTTIAYVVDPTMTGKMQQSAYEQAMAHARERVVFLAARHGIGPQQVRIRYGRIAHEIHELLDEGRYDCLMIGSHGWSGWRRILGSQANSILNNARVDTWVFKLEDTEDEAA